MFDKIKFRNLNKLLIITENILIWSNITFYEIE